MAMIKVTVEVTSPNTGVKEGREVLLDASQHEFVAGENGTTFMITLGGDQHQERVILEPFDAVEKKVMEADRRTIVLQVGPPPASMTRGLDPSTLRTPGA